MVRGVGLVTDWAALTLFTLRDTLNPSILYRGCIASEPFINNFYSDEEFCHLGQIKPSRQIWSLGASH